MLPLAALVSRSEWVDPTIMGSTRRLHGFPDASLFRPEIIDPNTSHFRLPPMGEDTSMDLVEENNMDAQEDVDMGVLKQALVPWAPLIEPTAWLASQCEHPFAKEEVMES